MRVSETRAQSMSLSTVYLSGLLGIVHLIRFFSEIILLILAEIRFSSCGSYLNEFLGYNHQSILFYYILIWISFSFEIYFLVNRLLGAVEFRARRSSTSLHILLGLAFALAASFTLYAWIDRSDGHVITQHDFGDPSQRVIPISDDCNRLRWTGIVLGLTISALYLVSGVFICRRRGSKDIG